MNTNKVIELMAMELNAEVVGTFQENDCLAVAFQNRDTNMVLMFYVNEDGMYYRTKECCYEIKMSELRDWL